MDFPQWATPQRRMTLVELWQEWQEGKGMCPYLTTCSHSIPGLCYLTAEDYLIDFWIAEDRIARAQAWKQEQRRLHAAPRLTRRGPFDTIARDEYLAKRPIFKIVDIGVGAFTFQRVAQVEIPGLRLTTWVDLSGLKLSKNKRHKLIRYGRGKAPKEIAQQIEDRVKAQVERLL